MCCMFLVWSPCQQEAKESHASSMEEKESLIQKLRSTLARKDKSLQEAIRQSPSATDAMIQQLQGRLKDKDGLIEVSAYQWIVG